jgi:hypothetical protein
MYWYTPAPRCRYVDAATRPYQLSFSLLDTYVYIHMKKYSCYMIQKTRLFLFQSSLSLSLSLVPLRS